MVITYQVPSNCNWKGLNFIAHFPFGFEDIIVPIRFHSHNSYFFMLVIFRYPFTVRDFKMGLAGLAGREVLPIKIWHTRATLSFFFVFYGLADNSKTVSSAFVDFYSLFLHFSKWQKAQGFLYLFAVFILEAF